MSKRVSVIVPIYNTEEYLNKCLRSICLQTYANLEIICIDDGSTDASGKIADLFAQADDRFIVVHKKNGGECSARNIGLDLATGDYITFVDCDDWLEVNMYEKLVEKIEFTGCDLVASGYCIATDHGSFRVENELRVTDLTFGNEELLSYVFKRDSYRGFSVYLWCKLFKRNAIYSNGRKITFDESLKLGGDILFFTRVATHVKKACYLDEAFYHYYQRSTSTFHAKRLDVLMDILRAYEYVITELESCMIKEETIRFVKRFLVYHAERAAKCAIEQNNDKILTITQRYMNCYEEEYVSTNQNYPERLREFYELKIKILGEQ